MITKQYSIEFNRRQEATSCPRRYYAHGLLLLILTFSGGQTPLSLKNKPLSKQLSGSNLPAGFDPLQYQSSKLPTSTPENNPPQKASADPVITTSEIQPASFKTQSVTNPIPTQLTLQQAIWYAMDHSEIIQQLQLQPRIQQTYISGEQAQFDTKVSSAIDASQSNQRVTSAVDAFGTGIDAISVTNYGGNRSRPDIFALEKKWETGTVTRLGMGNQYTNNSPSGSFLILNPAYTSNVALTLNQPLSQGLGEDFNNLGIRLSQVAKNKTEIDTQQQVNQLILEIEGLFWKCYSTSHELQIIKHEIEGAKRLYEQEKTSLELGNGNIFKLTKAEDYLHEINITYSQATLEHDLYLHQLGNALGFSVSAALNEIEFTAEPQNKLEDIDLNIAIQTAISSHAEIQSARQQLSLTQLRLEQSQEYLKPNINLIGRYGLSGVNDSLGSSIQDVTSLDYENWTLGLSYQTTLGKRNENALVHRSELEQHSALLELKRAERSLEFNVHQKIRQINTSYDVYQQQFFRMELLQRQLGSFEQLYQQQQINIEQFLDIRSSCLQAQRETTKSLIDFNIAISEFRHAIGQATVWANNYATSDHKQEITPLQEIIHPPAPAPATNPDPIPAF